MYVWSHGYFAHMCILSTHTVLGSQVFGQLMNGDLLPLGSLIYVLCLKCPSSPMPRVLDKLLYQPQLNCFLPCEASLPCDPSSLTW